MTAMVHDIRANAEAAEAMQPVVDDFLTVEELNRFPAEAAERSLKTCLVEMAELMGEKKWEDLVGLFSPVEEKLPELVEAELDAEPRAKVAFALGQLHRFDEAVNELEVCIRKDPENFHHHSSLAYTAYNSLWAAKNREILLAGKAREERIDLAHREFERAQALRPDGVTNFYRQGMLTWKLQGRSRNAVPLFEKAILNWDRLDTGQKKIRQQEHKNFVKSLYQLSSCLLDLGKGKKALGLIRRCIAEDEATAHLLPVHKYFALGKVLFHCNDLSGAKDALIFAARCDKSRPIDFVYELLGRTLLAQGNAQAAMDALKQVPEQRRRPYVRWTEADILCSLGKLSNAKRVLVESQERDARSRHKSLIRIARIDYVLGDMAGCERSAKEAGAFYHQKWGGVLDESLFWQALCAYRTGNHDAAKGLTAELESVSPAFPRLAKLKARLSAVSAAGG